MFHCFAKGFLNMVKNRTKLLFIRTPGAKKALHGRSGDGFTKELQEALKVRTETQFFRQVFVVSKVG